MNKTLGALLIATGGLTACAEHNIENHPLDAVQESTGGTVSTILSSTEISINGQPYILELYPTNTEYAINDDACSIDPSTSHAEEIPEDYHHDTVTACLYPQSQ